MDDQKTQPTNVVNISDKQVAQVSATALGFFRMETTLIPGNIRRQLDVLEAILTGLASGNLVVASPAQLAVESKPDKTDKTKEPDDDGPRRDGETPEAETEKGRESTGRKLPEETARMEQADSSAGSDASASGAE